MTSKTNQRYGWWQASDGNWYPPEQHPGYRGPQRSYAPDPGPDTTPRAELGGLPLLEVPSLPGLGQPGPQTHSDESKRKWTLAAVGAVVVVLLLIGGIAMMSHGSSPKASVASPPTSNAVNAIELAANQYRQYESEFASNATAPIAAITAANADVTKQDDRIANDQTTYQNNEFGSGCDAADYNNYPSCVAQEQQTAAGAQADETAAQASLKADANQVRTADQQAETVISTFVQQLDSIAWPTSGAIRQDAGQLAQSFTDLRTAFGQEGTDILNGLSVAQDNQAISSTDSDIQTEGVNLATALGIPPPSASATT